MEKKEYKRNANIKSIKPKDDRIKIVLDVSYKDSIRMLKGCLSDILLVSNKNITEKTKVAGRGKKDATKYFKAPLKDMNLLKSGDDTGYQRIDTEDEHFFIFSIKKKKDQL